MDFSRNSGVFREILMPLRRLRRRAQEWTSSCLRGWWTLTNSFRVQEKLREKIPLVKKAKVPVDKVVIKNENGLFNRMVIHKMDMQIYGEHAK